MKNGLGSALVFTAAIYGMGTTGCTIGSLIDDSCDKPSQKEKNYQIFKTEEFKETEKPNAVMILPTSDWNGAFSPGSIPEKFQPILEHYDVSVHRVHTEKEACDAIKAVNDIEFLLLGGHGSQTTMQWGESGDETALLDVNDAEFEDCLYTLKNSATIFLDSCSNGEGRETVENLANFVMKLAPGVRVVAVERPFSHPEITITTYFPFKASIKGVTYENLFEADGRIARNFNDIVYKPDAMTELSNKPHVETQKPNALFLIPKDVPFSGTMGHNPAMRRLASQARGEYDVTVREVSTVGEACAYLKGIQNIELLVLAGWNNGGSMLSWNGSKLDWRTNSLWSGAKNIKECFSTLKEGGSILLYTYLGFTPGKTDDLAHVLMQLAPKQAVFATSLPGSQVETSLSIVSWHPFFAVFKGYDYYDREVTFADSKNPVISEQLRQRLHTSRADNSER